MAQLNKVNRNKKGDDALVKQEPPDVEIIDDDDICELEHLRKLFVGGLASYTSEESLKSFYAQWGSVVDVVVMRDTTTRRSRGFGFITYSKAHMVDKAQAARPHIIDGKSVEAKRALPRPEREKREPNISVKKLFVGGLKDNHDEDCLKEYFAQFGQVVSVRILTDKTTGKRRGFAFIEYDDYDAVDKAILQKSHSIKFVLVDVKKSVYSQEKQRQSAANGEVKQPASMPRPHNMPVPGGPPAPPPAYGPPPPGAHMPPYAQGPPMNVPPQQPPNYNYWGPAAPAPQQQPPPLPPPQQYGGYAAPPMNNWNYGPQPPQHNWHARPPAQAPVPAGPPVNWQQQQQHQPQSHPPLPPPQHAPWGAPPVDQMPPNGPPPNWNQAAPQPPPPNMPQNHPPIAGPPVGHQPPPPQQQPQPNFGSGYQQHYGGGPTKQHNHMSNNRMNPYAPQQHYGNRGPPPPAAASVYSGVYNGGPPTGPPGVGPNVAPPGAGAPKPVPPVGNGNRRY